MVNGERSVCTLPGVQIDCSLIAIISPINSTIHRASATSGQHPGAVGGGGGGEYFLRALMERAVWCWFAWLAKKINCQQAAA